MTCAELISGLRVLVHDTGAGFSADNPFFSTEEIIDNLTTARSELVRLLSGSPSPPYVTLSRMTKRALAISGTAVPSDFYRLICGFDIFGTYSPAVSIRIGEAMKNIAVNQIYVKDNKFFGTASSALYWASPSQAITDDATVLSEFGDAFYYAVKYQAALALLAKEEANVWTRYMSIQGDLQRKIASFN